MGEEEETPRRCKTWEEEIYWTHFHFTRFSLFLHPGFEQCLALPQQFSSYLEKKLPKTVTLKGPSGINWRVGLMALSDTIYFAHGWEEFVKDHFLKENDLLVFKYNGESCFEVLMFDGDNLCEIPASYFVRKCLRKEQAGKQEVPDNVCLEVSHTFGKNIEDVTMTKLAEDSKIGISLEGLPMVSPLTNKRNHFQMFNSLHSNLSSGSEETSSYDEEIEIIPGQAVSSGLGRSHKLLRSSRKLRLTEEDKNSALQLAQAAISSKGFAVVMKPARLSAVGKYHLPIPTEWITANLGSVEKQDVILRVNGKMWITKFSYRTSDQKGGIFAGWKNFLMENKVRAYDVCAFEPGTPENNAFALDVNIFRVGEKASPLTLAEVDEDGYLPQSDLKI